MEKHNSKKVRSTAVPKLLYALLAAEIVIIAVLIAVAVGLVKNAGSSGGKEHDVPVDVNVSEKAPALTFPPIIRTELPTESETEEATLLPADTAAAEASLTPGTTAEATAAPTQAQTEPPTSAPTAAPTEAAASPAATAVPRTDGPLLNRSTTYSSRGVNVTATVCMPQTNGTPCPFVVLAHGFGGEKNCGGGFTHIAEALYAQGIASIRIDFSGCGDSTESSAKYCLTEMRVDIVNAIAHMSGVYNVDRSRVGLLGYSMGGRAVLETLAAGAANPYAVLLIAPAASTSDFIRLVGGQSVWESKRAEAQENGHAVVSGVDLGYAFFSELDARESPAQAAAAHYHGKAGVIYATNDVAVLPSVSSSVAQTLGCETLVLEGCGHAYGLFGSGSQYLASVTEFALRIFG